MRCALFGVLLLVPKEACGIVHEDCCCCCCCCCCDFGCGAAAADVVVGVTGGWCVGRMAGWSCTISPSVATHASIS